MRGAIHPVPNTPSWRGPQLKKKHRGNFAFTSTFHWNTAYSTGLHKNMLQIYWCEDYKLWKYDIISL